MLSDTLRLEEADAFARRVLRLYLQPQLHRQKPKIVILQSVYDPNGAFDKGGDKGLIEVFSRIEKFEVEHKYVDGIATIHDSLVRISKSGPIAHLVIMAHGTASKIALSPTNNLDISRGSKALFTIFVEFLKGALAPNASIFLHSCAVGQGGKGSNNIAEQLSIQTGRTVWGAEQNINRGDVLVTDIGIHDDYLDIVYAIDNDQVRSQGRTPYRMVEFNARQRQQREQQRQQREQQRQQGT